MLNQVLGETEKDKKMLETLLHASEHRCAKLQQE